MWHTVAGVREKQARDFILHGDTEEYIALLAITIDVMRWLTSVAFFAAFHGTETRDGPSLRSAHLHIRIMSPFCVLCDTSRCCSPVPLSSVRMIFGIGNFVDMHAGCAGNPHLNEV